MAKYEEMTKRPRERKKERCSAVSDPRIREANIAPQYIPACSFCSLVGERVLLAEAPFSKGNSSAHKSITDGKERLSKNSADSIARFYEKLKEAYPHPHPHPNGPRYSLLKFMAAMAENMLSRDVVIISSAGLDPS